MPLVSADVSRRPPYNGEDSGYVEAARDDVQDRV